MKTTRRRGPVAPTNHRRTYEDFSKRKFSTSRSAGWYPAAYYHYARGKKKNPVALYRRVFSVLPYRLYRRNPSILSGVHHRFVVFGTLSVFVSPVRTIRNPTGMVGIDTIREKKNYSGDITRDNNLSPSQSPHAAKNLSPANTATIIVCSRPIVWAQPLAIVCVHRSVVSFWVTLLKINVFFFF